MTSNDTVECTVCFIANYKFKVLDCGHEFCTECLEKLSKPIAPSHQSIAINLSTAVQQMLAQSVIECPKCRSTTRVLNGKIDTLKSHFIGSIMCYQCDTEKLTKEFRWCHTCNRSVCSACFIENHITADGVGFHESTKWDAHVGVKTATSRLLQRSATHTYHSMRRKMDVTEYLNGLNMYLSQKIDESAKISQSMHSSMANQINQAYGINTDEIPKIFSFGPAQTVKPTPMPDDKLQYALNEAHKVARLSSSDANLVDIRFQQVPYEQLEKLLLPQRAQLTANASKSDKLVSTEFLSSDKVAECKTN